MMDEARLQELLEKNQQRYRVRIGERLPQTVKISFGDSDLDLEKMVFHVGDQDYGLRYGTKNHFF